MAIIEVGYRADRERLPYRASGFGQDMESRESVGGGPIRADRPLRERRDGVALSLERAHQLVSMLEAAVGTAMPTNEKVIDPPPKGPRPLEATIQALELMTEGLVKRLGADRRPDRGADRAE